MVSQGLLLKSNQKVQKKKSWGDMFEEKNKS